MLNGKKVTTPTSEDKLRGMREHIRNVPIDHLKYATDQIIERLYNQGTINMGEFEYLKALSDRAK